MSLKNQVALVTGATSEIGQAYVKYLLQNRIKVMLCDVNIEHCQFMANNLVKEFQNISVLSTKCDVTNADGFENAFKTCMKHFGRLDIVINNAGVFHNSSERWSTIVNINYGGIVRGTLLAIKYMGLPNGGRGGTVIQTTSLKVFSDDYNYIPIMYKSTKQYVMEFTRRFGGKHNFDLHGVRIISLCPGLTGINFAENVRIHETICEDKKKINEQHNDLSQMRSLMQKPDHVGHALIEILEQGKTGESWIVENNKPPRLFKH